MFKSYTQIYKIKFYIKASKQKKIKIKKGSNRNHSPTHLDVHNGKSRKPIFKTH